MSELSPLDILVAARAKIADPCMWGKGGRPFDRPLETCCTAEAIKEAVPFDNYDRRTRAFRAFYNAAGLEWKKDALVHWNDAPERTHAEVLATFNLAIALERNMPRDA